MQRAGIGNERAKKARMGLIVAGRSLDGLYKVDSERKVTQFRRISGSV